MAVCDLLVPSKLSPDPQHTCHEPYPAAVIDILDLSKPHPSQLLGVDIVVWKDGQDKWNVFEDKCPHRAAPLSEGRIEDDGTLLCAYHAWWGSTERARHVVNRV